MARDDLKPQLYFLLKYLSRNNSKKSLVDMKSSYLTVLWKMFIFAVL